MVCLNESDQTSNCCPRSSLCLNLWAFTVCNVLTLAGKIALKLQIFTRLIAVCAKQSFRKKLGSFLNSRFGSFLRGTAGLVKRKGPSDYQGFYNILLFCYR